MLGVKRKRIAVVGTGVSGMAAAWLLNQRHDVTVYEKDAKIGGHCNTVDVPVGAGAESRIIPVDTGFIVYNEATYPNLTAMFAHLAVPTELSDMSFSASVDSGRFEYSGTNLFTMVAQKRNLVRPRFWAMVRDILRFYGEAVDDAARPENADVTLGDYLTTRGYSEAFLRDHLLPMGACIWSASLKDMRAYPLPSFVRFFKNHGLLEMSSKKRPRWRTVTGGSRAYVERLTAPFAQRVRLSSPVRSVRRLPGGVEIKTAHGADLFDDVVFATHSDQALALLQDATPQERRCLGAIRYERNRAVLHSDMTLMPKRQRAWSSWNYVASSGGADDQQVCLTYWMNMLQNIDRRFPLFVTLNPHRAPEAGTQYAAFEYEHPVFDRLALEAQQELWTLQGINRAWFCGAYFGHGFHEDGLQAGLAVGEALGNVRRPWTVKDESGRIFLPTAIAAAA
jgi:predicted NAD/FAD-binding protein